MRYRPIHGCNWELIRLQANKLPPPSGPTHRISPTLALVYSLDADAAMYHCVHA